MSSSRFTEATSQVPLCTLCVTTLCIGLHICELFFESPTQQQQPFALSAANVIYLGEYYRIVSGALLHVDLLHIGFNMMSFLGIGSGLEMVLGTLSMAFIIIWSILLTGAVHVAISWVMTVWLAQDMSYIYQMSKGFSGVIFTLALMECHRSTRTTRSVFGFFQVPTKLYPWVLLVLISCILRHVSFLGHLSGILVGMMHVYGLTKMILPSPAFLMEIESCSYIRDQVGQRTNFISCPAPQTAADEELYASGNPFAGLRGSLILRMGSIWRSLAFPLRGLAGRMRDRGVWRSGSTAADGDIEATARLSTNRT